MTKKIPAIAVTGVLVFAWMQPAVAQNCKGPDDFRLTVDKYKLDLDERKQPLCISPDDPIFISIHNPPGWDHNVEAGDVTVENKVANCEILISGSNSEEEAWLEISAVENASGTDDCLTDEGTYEFLIHVDGVGTLDPAVRVIDASLMLDLTWGAVEDALKPYDTDINTLLRDGGPPPPPESGK